MKDISQITTYQSGIIQAKAHRLLSKYKAEVLQAYDLTIAQWYVVGLAHDAGDEGVRLTDLTEQLGTSLPFITTTINQLELKGIVTKGHQKGDNRVRIVRLNPGYTKTVSEIEESMRTMLRKELYRNDNVSRQELSDYISVLYKIVER